MTRPKLYISDLDGTLLDSTAKLSDFAFDNLSNLMENGIDFTIATARSIVSAREILRGLHIRIPIIEINGALISDLTTGIHHTINHIPKETVEKLYTHIADHGCHPFISSFDGKRDNLYYQKVANDGMKWFLGDDTEDHAKRVRFAGNIADAFTEDVVCITVIDQEPVMAKLSEKLKTEFTDELENHFFQNPYCRQWYWLTIHDRRSCKAKGVKQLAKKLGYPLEDVVVFGDGLNDIEMMKLNRHGVHTVAVGNALDEVKELASEVIDSNEDNAVVNYILKEANL